MASRTMIYLEPGQLDALKRRARKERTSVAALVRRFVDRCLDRDPRARPSEDVYARLVGLGSSGLADAGDDHDRRLSDALTRGHLR